MPNENNTNQINSGDIGNFPDTALGQENPTHHSPAVREEAGQEKIQAIVEREAKALDWLYEIPLDAMLASDIHIGSKLTGIHGDAGCVSKVAEDGIVNTDILDPRLVIRPFGFAHDQSNHVRDTRMFEHAHLGAISETELAEKLKRRAAALHLTDLSPYFYIPPMQPYGHRISVSSIRYDSSRKAKLRKISQLKKRVAASRGAKKYLFKELLKTVKRVLNKINNSSLSGAHVSTRRGKATFKASHKREREFLLYGIPFPVQKYYFPGTELTLKDARTAGEPVAGGLLSSMTAVSRHASLTAQARRMQGFDGLGVDSDLSGTQNMRHGLARLHEIELMGNEAKRFAQNKIWTAQGVELDFGAPDVSGYKNPDENCKGCGNCEKKLPVLELMEHGLDLVPVVGEILSIAEQISDVSVKDAYPNHYAIQEVAASAVEADKRDDDAAGDERFALDA